MKREEEVDRRRGGSTILKSGQELTLPAQVGQLKTEQGEKGLLRRYMWYPHYARLWDRIEIEKKC